MAYGRECSSCGQRRPLTAFAGWLRTCGSCWKKMTHYPNIRYRAVHLNNRDVTVEEWTLTIPAEHITEETAQSREEARLRQEKLEALAAEEARKAERKKAARTGKADGGESDFYGGGQKSGVIYEGGKPVFGQAAPVRRGGKRKKSDDTGPLAA